jgi:hypothetical protein
MIHETKAATVVAQKVVAQKVKPVKNTVASTATSPVVQPSKPVVSVEPMAVPSETVVAPTPTVVATGKKLTLKLTGVVLMHAILNGESIEVVES